MTALDAAIQLAFTGNVTLTNAFTGGMWADLADPQTAVPPFLVYTVLSAKTETVYGNKHRSKVYVQFTAVGIGKTATGALMDTFTGVFDDTVLTLTSGVNYDCRRTMEPIPHLWRPRDGAGQERWAWQTEYVYEIRN